jgi:Rrf2 family protein
MKLSRTVAYAVQATLLLADSKSPTPVPCSQLAARGHMPERFLLQILRHLVTHGILRSTRGVDGGYALLRSPQDISLLELIEAVDGPIVATLPTIDGGPSGGYQGRLHKAMEQVVANMRRQLQSIKVSDLAASSATAKMA